MGTSGAGRTRLAGRNGEAIDAHLTGREVRSLEMAYELMNLRAEELAERLGTCEPRLNYPHSGHGRDTATSTFRSV